MPRNGAGLMSIVNTFVPGTVIQSAQVNANNNDIAAELTNSLPRDGQAGMTGPLLLMDGTLGAPGLAFVGDPNTGIRRTADGEFRFVVNGVDAMTINAGTAADIAD